MYDKAKDDWRFRQTGIMVDVRKAYGNLFVGRTKEGFSTSKIMVGYQGWTNERATMNDALIPILADGIKWNGYIPNGKFLYNIGFFRDTRSEAETFNKNDKQTAVRGVWLPLAGQETEKGVLHIAVQARHARSTTDSCSTGRSPSPSRRSRTPSTPESSTRNTPTPTGSKPTTVRAAACSARSTSSTRPRRRMSAIRCCTAAKSSWRTSSPARPSRTTRRGGYFERLSPSRPVFSGGPGAWELVTRFSYSDMDDKEIHGGKFWRFTPMVNWHMSDNVRLEFVYGYSSLDRFGVDRQDALLPEPPPVAAVGLRVAARGSPVRCALAVRADQKTKRKMLAEARRGSFQSGSTTR